MEKLVLFLQTSSALVIIVLIMLQQGKGAAAGASFGAGASQTVFGSDGGGNFFTRLTAIFATIFFVTSLGLAMLAKQHSQVSAQSLPTPASSSVPAAPASDVPVQTAPASSDVPATTPEQPAKQ